MASHTIGDKTQLIHLETPQQIMSLLVNLRLEDICSIRKPAQTRSIRQLFPTETHSSNRNAIYPRMTTGPAIHTTAHLPRRDTNGRRSNRRRERMSGYTTTQKYTGHARKTADSSRTTGRQVLASTAADVQQHTGTPRSTQRKKQDATLSTT